MFTLLKFITDQCSKRSAKRFTFFHLGRIIIHAQFLTSRSVPPRRTLVLQPSVNSASLGLHPLRRSKCCHLLQMNSMILARRNFENLSNWKLSPSPLQHCKLYQPPPKTLLHVPHGPGAFDRRPTSAQQATNTSPTQGSFDHRVPKGFHSATPIG